MLNVKTGKEEIVYLLTKAIEKYNIDTGEKIILNTNRKNYEKLAILLSDISNKLPEISETVGAENYSPDYNSKTQEYPHRKYDITGGQIKDAISGIVANPRPFLVDSCYIYLYGVGRKGFKQNPLDPGLLDISIDENKDAVLLLEMESSGVQKQLDTLQKQYAKKSKAVKVLAFLTIAVIVCLGFFYFNFAKKESKWQSLKENMNILPYQPTPSEIDSMEGVWICYTGSPQARISNPSRYHKVVSNIVDVQFKDGYFTYNRFGASFNHVGYMQFESPGIVSIYSRIKNNAGKTESPRHSLMSLHTDTKFLPAISASWNFDVGEKNTIIGIREIYIKLGKGGRLEEVINDLENASCQCKIIRWNQPNNTVKTFYLKNELLDSLPLIELKPLINENSILLSMPRQGLVLSSDSLSK